MNNGSRRRGRRRYKVRYDRIIAVALVFIVLIFLMVSCAKGCSDDDKKDETSKSQIDDQLSTGQDSTNPTGQISTDSAGNIIAQPNNQATAEFTTESHEYSDINNGDLVLVNSLYAYKFQQNDVTLSTLYNTKNDYYGTIDNVLSLDSKVITQINSMMEAYAKANSLFETDLRVIGGFRTLEKQNDKYMSGSSKFQGGYTDYHTGRSFDIGIFPKTGSSGYYRAEGNYAWINNNAANYGFVVRFLEGKDTVTGENARAYTFRYVGVPHALFMKQNNLCLEEYIEQIKSYTNSNPLAVTSGTAVYQVYYVAANANSATDVPVPSNLPYTVSGNNVDGFIVTVTVSQ